jgi:hypothetical protein
MRLNESGCDWSQLAPHPSKARSIEFGEVLDDPQVLQSVVSVGDAYDNALAESFVDTIDTELIDVLRGRVRVVDDELTPPRIPPAGKPIRSTAVNTREVPPFAQVCA